MIIVAIPCYNVERYCENVIREALPLAGHLIAVDDGSADRTGMILHKIAQAHPQKMSVIPFPHNRGKGFAILAALQYALRHFDFQIMITMDGDGQHAPSAIPGLVEAVQDGADMAIGVRSFHQMPVKNRLGNAVISFLLRCVYPDTPSDTQSGYRAMSHALAFRICQNIQGGRYETEMKILLFALSRKYGVREVPIPTIYIDKNRSSHFHALRDSFRVLWIFFDHIMRRREQT